MSESKHTFKQLEVAHYENGMLEGTHFLRDTENQESICSMSFMDKPEQVIANAAHIVKCVNMWEEGITVMEAALKALTAASETNIGKWHYEAERLVRDFLAKAKAGE